MKIDRNRKIIFGSLIVIALMLLSQLGYYFIQKDQVNSFDFEVKYPEYITIENSEDWGLWGLYYDFIGAKDGFDDRIEIKLSHRLLLNTTKYTLGDIILSSETISVPYFLGSIPWLGSDIHGIFSLSLFPTYGFDKNFYYEWTLTENSSIVSQDGYFFNLNSPLWNPSIVGGGDNETLVDGNYTYKNFGNFEIEGGDFDRANFFSLVNIDGYNLFPLIESYCEIDQDTKTCYQLQNIVFRSEIIHTSDLLIDSVSTRVHYFETKVAIGNSSSVEI